jgi:hypothetical protein
MDGAGLVSQALKQNNNKSQSLPGAGWPLKEVGQLACSLYDRLGGIVLDGMVCQYVAVDSGLPHAGVTP